MIFLNIVSATQYESEGKSWKVSINQQLNYIHSHVLVGNEDGIVAITSFRGHRFKQALWLAELRLG